MLIFDYVKPSIKVNSCKRTILFQLHKSNSKIDAKSSTEQNKAREQRKRSIQATLRYLQNKDYDESDEDAIEEYITTLKMLIMELSTGDFHQLFDIDNEEVTPLIQSLHKCGHHRNLLIKSTARLCFLTIFKNCGGHIKKYILEYALPLHLKSIISFLKCSIFYLLKSIDSTEKVSVEAICREIEEEFEYIDDILCLENVTLATKARFTLLKDFVYPIIFQALIGQPSIIRKPQVAFFLMGKLLHDTTNREFKENILYFFIPIELNETLLKNIFLLENSSFEMVIKFRHRTIQSLKDAISSLESNSLPLYAVCLLYALAESFISLKDMDGILLLHKTYNYSLMQFLQAERNSLTRFETETFNLIVFLLKQLVMLNSKDNTKNWQDYRKITLRTLKNIYLRTCLQVKFYSILKFASTIDTAYKQFLAEKEDRTRLLKYSGFLLDKDKCSSNIKNEAESEMNLRLKSLLILRTVILRLSDRKETILPIIKRKIKVGVTLPLEKSMPCKKLVHSGKFSPNHFLLFTRNQILVAQGTDNNERGIGIFNPYYKDIYWKKSKDNCLMICENCCSEENNSDPMEILLKFKSGSNVQKVVNTLDRAIMKQNSVILKKLNDLKLYKTSNSVKA